MKRLKVLVPVLCCCAVSQAQVSLREYCPSKLSQYIATCASYAPAYTALSTQYNAYKGFKTDHPDSYVFSDGFVASKMKANKPLLRGRLFNRCGKKVTAEMALNVLKETGTVLKKDFPEGCDCDKQRRVQASSRLYKIASWKQISDDDSTAAYNINSIRQSLDERRPVIVAILQTPFFRNNKKDILVFPGDYQRQFINANHVVCIVGYDSINGKNVFLVKNNYKDWGDGDGFSYVACDDMMKLVRSAYQMTLQAEL